MTDTLLISYSDFPTYVDVSSHIDEKYMNRHILNAQQRYILPLLGREQYEQVLDEKSSGYFTELNETLLSDYVKPALVFRSYQMYLPHSSLFNTGMGIRTMTEDNSQPVTQSELKVLISEAESMAEFHEAEMKNYLRANATDFEEYQDATDKNSSSYLPSITAAGKRPYRERKSFYDKE